MKECNKLVTRVRVSNWAVKPSSIQRWFFFSIAFWIHFLFHALDFSYLHPNWICLFFGCFFLLHFCGFDGFCKLNAIHRYRLFQTTINESNDRLNVCLFVWGRIANWRIELNIRHHPVEIFMRDETAHNLKMYNILALNSNCSSINLTRKIQQTTETRIEKKRPTRITKGDQRDGETQRTFLWTS